MLQKLIGVFPIRRNPLITSNVVVPIATMAYLVYMSITVVYSGETS